MRRFTVEEMVLSDFETYSNNQNAADLDVSILIAYSSQCWQKLLNLEHMAPASSLEIQLYTETLIRYITKELKFPLCFDGGEEVLSTDIFI